MNLRWQLLSGGHATFEDIFQFFYFFVFVLLHNILAYCSQKAVLLDASALGTRKF